jgi:hypothetical protein
MTDDMIAKAIREMEASKEKETEERISGMTEKIKEMIITRDDLEQELLKKDERIAKLEEYIKAVSTNMP